MGTLQKLKKVDSNALTVAERYYSILSVINDLELTKRELQLIAFTAMRGNMSYKEYREEFCSMYKSSSPSINNMISKLKKSNILVKDNNKIKVHPKIQLDFSKPLKLEIFLMTNIPPSQ
jgi:hypothetical protein